MPYNLRREDWSSEQQYDAVRGLTLDIERLQDVIGREQSGDFLATLTGMNAATQARVKHRIVAGICFLWTTAAFQGISNTTSMTMTNLPTIVRPANNRIVQCVVLDNASFCDGVADVDANGSITFYRDNGTGVFLSTGFAAAGDKGVPIGWTAIYPLD